MTNKNPSRVRITRFLVGTLYLSLMSTAYVSPTTPVPKIAGCSIFPRASSPEAVANVNISEHPLDPNSNNYIASYPGHLNAGFGKYKAEGLPINIVPNNQPLVPITFTLYPTESDPGPYPIPSGALIQTEGTDHHLLIVQRGKCLIYEMWRAAYSPSTGWTAANGAIFNLTTGALRHTAWTSADAAGMPMIPGIIRCVDMASGSINHALYLVLPNPPPTYAGFISPATHYVGSSKDSNYMPMGERVRLRSSFDISGFTGQAHIILRALEQYGAFVEDGGPPGWWQVAGASDQSCWNNAELLELQSVPNTAFEAVNTSPIQQLNAK